MSRWANSVSRRPVYLHGQRTEQPLILVLPGGFAPLELSCLTVDAHASAGAGGGDLPFGL